MDKFWKWLMRTDARSIFLVALLLFLAVSGWRLWVHLTPPPEPDTPVVKAPPPTLSRFRPLGVIGFVSNQFAPNTLILPVNPFRPTFEMMVLNPETGDLQEMVRAIRERDRSTWGRGGSWSRGGDGTSRDSSNRPSGERPSGDSPPPPRYAYKGMFQRPDGKVAAYIVRTPGGGHFVTAGSRIANADVTEASAAAVILKLADGTTITLRPGEPPTELRGGQE